MLAWASPIIESLEPRVLDEVMGALFPSSGEGSPPRLDVPEWDITYDAVLRSALPPGASAVCYTDDTLVLAGGKDWGKQPL